jgi:exodeoxyribonuclease V alpha subunit
MRRGCTNADRIRGGELQKVLNPPDEASIQRFGRTFGAGDKVMQVENDYDKDVYKCDFGFVHAVDLEAGEVLVEFDGREVAYGFGELDELVLAYATTIHKSQGSEYPAVVTPLTTQLYPMLRCNLLYTGVTRAGGSWWSSVSVGQLASRFEAVSRSGAGRSSKSGSVPGKPRKKVPR